MQSFALNERFRRSKLWEMPSGGDIKPDFVVRMVYGLPNFRKGDDLQ